MLLRILTGKIHLQIKLKRLRKIWICIFGQLITLNQLFITGSYIQIKFKTKWDSDKSPFFLTGLFCTPHSICLNFNLYSPFNFDRAVLYENVALSFVVPFFRKVLVFQKTYFKVKVLTMFKIPSDCHIKTYQSLKRGPH